MFRALIAVSVATIAGLFRKCKQMHAELQKSRGDVLALEQKMETLSTTNGNMERMREEAEANFFEQLRQLKSEFEDEWLLREREWQNKLSSKEEDAQQRLVEISSWQSELSRLRTEAIAIRSAIEKVRSRSTSPGRSETNDSVSLISESVVSDISNKENGSAFQSNPDKSSLHPAADTAGSAYRGDPLKGSNGLRA
ncbi:hypothetical protein HOP50_08g50550 [Chloropicon primus]|uniref:Uncharacterized protein n=1 Tax=Chloropicon primus TaxID=1764295 RepID=A0A5B8MT12_9CHLO|nr:hypothetical protein A3770_08p50300 [Chloropicon primus]UPR01733.1 hypothetical protein HOP50_08g50550 [Chloropicon primus]|mmetsp:Transcript_4301/g.12617  ORF Transcript_4301/g.12617 Transcript_4301/m.12617 type:complete len:196 (+) Transcript_4301:158-745(+)|eukprot:QDZ22512.1 hypothetical protein A3770_08p50300 [Chloropicon primus]